MTTGPKTAAATGSRLPRTGSRSADGNPADRPIRISRGSRPGSTTSPRGRTSPHRHPSGAGDSRHHRHRHHHRHHSRPVDNNHRSTAGRVVSRAASHPLRREAHRHRHRSGPDNRVPTGGTYRPGPPPNNHHLRRRADHHKDRRHHRDRGSRMPGVRRRADPANDHRRVARSGPARTPPRSGPAHSSGRVGSNHRPRRHPVVNNGRQPTRTRPCNIRPWTAREPPGTHPADRPPAHPLPHRAIPADAARRATPPVPSKAAVPSRAAVRTRYRRGRPHRPEFRRAHPRDTPAPDSTRTIRVRHRRST